MRVTGKWIPDRRIEYVKCIEGHLAPYVIKDLLSEQGVSCPHCNTPIKLSREDEQLLRGTRVR